MHFTKSIFITVTTGIIFSQYKSYTEGISIVILSYYSQFRCGDFFNDHLKIENICFGRKHILAENVTNGLIFF